MSENRNYVVTKYNPLTGQTSWICDTTYRLTQPDNHLFSKEEARLVELNLKMNCPEMNITVREATEEQLQLRWMNDSE